jgi:phosphatidylglycerophosphatase A
VRRPDTAPPVLALAIATALGAGYVPVAPGTAGSAVGLLLWWLLPAPPLVHALVIVMLFLLGSWSGSVAERHFQRTDPGPVVLDEVMGMLMTLFMVPVTWKGALAGFLWFRLFDIIKPVPANRAERLPGGVGIMADDGVAGIYANLALRASLWLAGRLL